MSGCEWPEGFWPNLLGPHIGQWHPFPHGSTLLSVDCSHVLELGQQQLTSLKRLLNLFYSKLLWCILNTDFQTSSATSPFPSLHLLRSRLSICSFWTTRRLRYPSAASDTSSRSCREMVDPLWYPQPGLTVRSFSTHNLPSL